MSLDRTGSNIKGTHNTPGIRGPNTPKPESISRVVGPKHRYGNRTQSKLQIESTDPHASALLSSSPDGPSSPGAHGTLGQSPGFAQPALTETPVKKPEERTEIDGTATLPSNDSNNSGIGSDYDGQNPTINTPANLSPVQGRLARFATKRIAEDEGTSTENVDSRSMPDVQRSTKRKRAGREDWRVTQHPGQEENDGQSPVLDNHSSPNITPEAFEQAEEDHTYYDEDTDDDYTYVGGGASENHLRFIMEVSVPIPSNLGKRNRGDWDP